MSLNTGRPASRVEGGRAVGVPRAGSEQTRLDQLVSAASQLGEERLELLSSRPPEGSEHRHAAMLDLGLAVLIEVLGVGQAKRIPNGRRAERGDLLARGAGATVEDRSFAPSEILHRDV